MSSRPYVDEYWTLGKTLAAGRLKFTVIEKRDFGSAFIKIFFYPMMFVYIEQYLGLLGRSWFPETWTAAELYECVATCSLLIDLVFGASGYALSLRILGNRVQSINPYPAGWLVTIICYSPFWGMLPAIIIFRWQVNWIAWTSDWPLMQAVWLTMIVCGFVVYAWATVEMGPRFSNLTYRGTVDSGPYRLMKHPAYVSKVALYWLVSVPFVPLHGWTTALAQCFALLLLSAVYYFRAMYEEKHLSSYPEYNSYASDPILRPAPA
jgi:isoprenylcysteine carboxyl methyltransferase (ICMT) family protein YpbQ